MFRAAEYWFPEQIAALERGARSQSETKPDNSVEAAVRAFSQPHIPDALQLELQDILNQTIHRLRNFLHQDRLKAYYSGMMAATPYHGHSACRWRDTSGTYCPFGRPARWYEWRPNYSLFLLQSELDALLSEQPAKKRPLPKTKMPELVAALRKLDDLPNRAAQLEALCNMPEFREFKITDALFREAPKEAGQRRAGRKSRRQS